MVVVAYRTSPGLHRENTPPVRKGAPVMRETGSRSQTEDVQHRRRRGVFQFGLCIAAFETL
jgi:hypothetical protein